MSNNTATKFNTTTIEVPFDKEWGVNVATWVHDDVRDVEQLCKAAFQKRRNFPTDVNPRRVKMAARSARVVFYGVHVLRNGKEHIYRLEPNESCADLHHIKVSCRSEFVVNEFVKMIKGLVNASFQFHEAEEYKNALTEECPFFHRSIDDLNYKLLCIVFDESIPDPEELDKKIYIWRNEFDQVARDIADNTANAWLCNDRKKIIVQGTDAAACLRVILKIREFYNAKKTILLNRVKTAKAAKNNPKSSKKTKVNTMNTSKYDMANPYTCLYYHGYAFKYHRAGANTIGSPPYNKDKNATKCVVVY